MDQEAREKLKERLGAIEDRLREMSSEGATAFQFRVYATHLLEAADRLDIGDVGYGFLVAETMSYELNFKIAGLKNLVMSLSLEGRSLTEVLNEVQNVVHTRFVELLEQACAALPRDGK